MTTNNPAPSPSIPTLTLGEYLYIAPQNCRNTVASFLIDPFADSFRLRPFNPSVILPSRYLTDIHGRTIANPAFRIAHQARYGFYEDEVRGSRVGERLATGDIGEVDAGVLRFCQDRGIPLSPVVTTGLAATQGNLSPFEVARLDALYVARGHQTAWDLLIAPASTPGSQGSGSSTGPATSPGQGSQGSTLLPSSGLDPTSAVIADLRQKLATQELLTTEAQARELEMETTVENIKKILSKKGHIPPARGGGAPTAKWRNFYNAIVAAVQGK